MPGMSSSASCAGMEEGEGGGGGERGVRVWVRMGVPLVG